MNPAFDPFNPMDPRTTGVAGQLATGMGAGGGGVPNQYANRVATQDTPSLAFARSGQSIDNLGSNQSLAGTQFDASQQLAQRPAPTGGMPQLNARGRPIPGWTNPNHQGPIGMDWSRYAMVGNMENSLVGAQGRYQPVDSVGDYPWMTDTSTQWGGGPFGYLPINYQPQAYSYYQNTQNLAPWEQKYMQDTWTQNYDRNQPGFVNTNRLANDPNYGANLRG